MNFVLPKGRARVLRRIFRSKREEYTTACWGSCNLVCSRNIIDLVESRRLECVKYGYKIRVGKPQMKRWLWRPWRRWKDNTKSILTCVEKCLEFARSGSGYYTLNCSLKSTGQERFTWMTRVYYKDSHGCVIMFDLTNRNSFINSLKWKRDVDSKCRLPDGSPIPCMLLANKVGQLGAWLMYWLSSVETVLSLWVRGVCLLPVFIVELLPNFDLENPWQKKYWIYKCLNLGIVSQLEPAIQFKI